MKILRAIAIALVAWVALGLLFDGLVGFFQPGSDVLRTFDAQGRPHDTALVVLEDGDTLWIESGHHFRRWYHRLRENPEVELSRGGVSRAYRAVPLDDPESQAHVIGLMKRGGAVGYYVGRFLLLFAEIKPVRLDPR